eukprot:jgi/Mesvir1/25106/Mv21569-RA.1
MSGHLLDTSLIPWLRQAHRDIQCPATEVPCTHNGGCGARVRREALPLHVATACLKTHIACSIPGCPTLVARGDMARHMESALVPHVSLLSSALHEANSQIAALKAQRQ